MRIGRAGLELWGASAHGARPLLSLLLAAVVLGSISGAEASSSVDHAAERGSIPRQERGSHSAGGKLQVSVPKSSRSQRALLRRKRVAVKVRAPGAGRLRVGVKLRPRRGGVAKRRLARPIKRRVDGRGTLVVRLKLTRRDRARVRRCGPRTLLPFARLRGADRKRTAEAKQRLRVDRRGCRGGGGNGGGGGGGGNGGGGGQPSPGNGGPTPQTYTGPPIETSPAEPLAPAGACDFFDRTECLYPFPNDRFTRADGASRSGRRVDFDLRAMPRNVAGAPVQPGEYNRNDGFSPGSSIIVKVAGLDTPAAFSQNALVGETDIDRYADPSQRVVVIDATSGERWPIWAELDSNPPERTPGNTGDVTLIVRPAVNFAEGHRYVVALRDLKDAGGETIQTSDAFRVYRDRLITTQPEVESRRPQMERIFADLGAAGIERSDLYLAWDFTVASRENLTGRMLHIRDDAFAQLGDTDLADGQVEGSSPAISNLQATDYSPADDPKIARKVTGDLTVPCYMNTPSCSPVGSTFNYPPGTDPDRLPTQLPANTASVGFTCMLPRDPATGGLATDVRPSLYGHGLLGGQGEVQGGNVKAMAYEHGMMFCATDWYGFATTNVPNVLLILQDISNFPLLGDETQQGMLNFLLLGRAMVHGGGLNARGAFQTGGGQGVIDTAKLFYDGNSQGGILGGSLTAVAPDFQRAVLGVPGMNYSTLLPRSVDFEPYAEGKFTPIICDAVGLPAAACPSDFPAGGLYDNYPDELERPLIFALLQMQWDRAEADGYAAHMTDDPLPNTPPHQVLLHAAFGDHQVANVSAEVEARTIGAGIYAPALDPGRHAGPIFGLAPIGFPRATPYSGSALVYWDGGPPSFGGGSATPPAANVPPRPPAYGADPHGYPRSDVKARAQKSEFLRDGGRLANFCTASSNPEGATPTEAGSPTPCYSNGYQGPP